MKMAYFELRSSEPRIEVLNKQDMKYFRARSIITFILTSLLSGLSLAYDEAVHETLTRAAARKSVLQTDPGLLQGLGLPAANQGNYPWFHQRAIQGTQSAIETAVHGAYEEDNYVGALSSFTHFFDPQANGGIGRGLEADAYWPLLGSQISSPLWATGIPARLGQEYSFFQGQQHLWNALTSSTPDNRANEFGFVFQTLGHLAHHMQDMGQPQHVRNEPHIHYKIMNFAEAFYERFTTQVVNPTLASDLNQWPPFSIPAYPLISQYWTGGPAGFSGMADVTAKNFLTYNSGIEAVKHPDNSFSFSSPKAFPLPNGAQSDFKVNSELVTIPTVDGTGQATATLYYLSGTVRDDFGGNKTNFRIAAQTRLMGYVSNTPPYRLILSPPNFFYFGEMDRQTLNDRLRFLLPRTVAFSTGLINHFFRARLGLTHVVDNTWRISNAGAYQMNGSYNIYSETTAGVRSATGISTNVSLPPGGSKTLELNFAKAPAKLVAVFQGTVGSEPGMVGGVVVPYISPPASIPCGKPISQEGGTEGYVTTMDMGSANGKVNVQFEAYAIPDALVISSGNRILTTSSGEKSGLQTYSFEYDSANGRNIKVAVTGNKDATTRWGLAVSCPGGVINPPKPQVQISFNTEPIQQNVRICGAYSVVINKQIKVVTGRVATVTAGSHLQMTVTHSVEDSNTCSNPTGSTLRDPGRFYYIDKSGKHYLSIGENWVGVN